MRTNLTLKSVWEKLANLLTILLAFHCTINQITLTKKFFYEMELANFERAFKARSQKMHLLWKAVLKVQSKMKLEAYRRIPKRILNCGIKYVKNSKKRDTVKPPNRKNKSREQGDHEERGKSLPGKNDKCRQGLKTLIWQP